MMYYGVCSFVRSVLSLSRSPPPSKQVRMLASGPSFPCQLVPRVRATYVVRSCVRLPRPGLARCCALRPRLPTSTYSRVQVRRQYANTPLHPAPPPTLSRPSSSGTAPPNRRHKRPPLDDSSSSPRAFTELGRSQPCSSMMTTASIFSC